MEKGTNEQIPIQHWSTSLRSWCILAAGQAHQVLGAAPAMLLPSAGAREKICATLDVAKLVEEFFREARGLATALEQETLFNDNGTLSESRFV